MKYWYSWLGYSARKLATPSTKAGLRPSVRPILTLPTSLAAGSYVRPFGPNESLILLKPTCNLDSRQHNTAPSCPTAPPSILTLVTWVQRTQAGLRSHQASRLAVGPSALGQTNPNSTRFAYHWLILMKPTRILDRLGKNELQELCGVQLLKRFSAKLVKFSVKFGSLNMQIINNFKNIIFIACKF